MSVHVTPAATTPIPVQLSETEFTTFILPHLTMPKRGPKCKLGYHRVFNLILWVLYTGMQWKCLPVPQDVHGKPAIHYTTIYRIFAKWAVFATPLVVRHALIRVTCPRSSALRPTNTFSGVGVPYGCGSSLRPHSGI